jgi:hypothetical protein
MISSPSEVEMNVYEGQEDPLRGWFCEKSARGFSPAPQVSFRYPLDSTFHVVMAMSTDGKNKPPSIKETRKGTARILRFDWPNGQTDELVLSNSMAACLKAESGYITDSPLLWLRRSAEGVPVRHFLFQGTYLKDQESGTVICPSED